MQNIEIIISKSNLLNKSEYSDDELEEYITIMENDSNLNRKDIYELIINEKIDCLVDNFKIVWTFIDKYDFDNINNLKIKYKKRVYDMENEINKKILIMQKEVDDKKKEIENEINKKIQLYNKANELDGNVFLRYIGATYSYNKIEYLIKTYNLCEIKILGDKMKELIDNIKISNSVFIHSNCIKELPLTSLDLSWNNGITDDDIKRMPLTCLNYEITDHDIIGMSLTSLDLRCNNKITDDGIRGLPLTSLDLSHNNLITDNGIKGMSLTSLNLRNNKKITDNGIKGMPLTSLDLSYNNTITDDGIRGMPLTDLILINNYKITDDGIREMPLTSLDISYNNTITDDGIKEMQLTSLNLCHNNTITDDGIKGLPLTNLDLRRNNKITNKGIKGMSLTYLYLDRCNGIKKTIKDELIKKGCRIYD